MAQIFVVVTKTGSPLITQGGKEQEEVFKVQSKPLKTLCDLERIFECFHDLPIVNTNGPRTPNGVLVRFSTLTSWVPMIVQTSLWCCDYTWEKNYTKNCGK